eukprot:TRINITY_DN24476_c0_g1_i1.p1 TRINITY_DN24476_c0_g1~~TRINITY_DN24476_c0_g1_i1.p1  ORF type:complete len:301 (+),score=77.07 TRINITY_DN24476_c0_g1_i1:31-933(+)
MDLEMLPMNDLGVQIEMTELNILLCTYRKQKSRLRNTSKAQGITDTVLSAKELDEEQSARRHQWDTLMMDSHQNNTLHQEEHTRVINKEDIEADERAIHEMKKKLRKIAANHDSCEATRKAREEEANAALQQRENDVLRKKQDAATKILEEFYLSEGLHDTTCEQEQEETPHSCDNVSSADLDIEEQLIQTRLDACFAKTEIHARKISLWSLKVQRESDSLKALQALDHDEQVGRRAVFKAWSEDRKGHLTAFKATCFVPKVNEPTLEQIESQYISLAKRIDNENTRQKYQAPLYSEFDI